MVRGLRSNFGSSFDRALAEAAMEATCASLSCGMSWFEGDEDSPPLPTEAPATVSGMGEERFETSKFETGQEKELDP